MLARLKANRLKIASVCAVTGDVFMGLTGTAGLFNWNSLGTASDTAMLTGGIIAVIGHSMLLLWGKGGRLENKIRTSGAHHGQWAKPFMPWRYPLDTALAFFIFSGCCYGLAGLFMGSFSMLITGICVGLASAIGWLLPQDRLLLGLRGMQWTAGLYLTATSFTYLAAYENANILLFAGALFYTACNLILFTVRKENQSEYTLGHE